MANTVKMVREVPNHPKGPTTADVHPAEVQGWTLGGWRLAEEKKAAPVKKAPVKKSGSSKKKNPEPDLEDLV